MKTSTVVIKGKLLKNIKRITFRGSGFDYWLLAHLKWWINDDYPKKYRTVEIFSKRAPQTTSCPGCSPRSKWRSEKPLAKTAEILHESWSILSRDTSWNGFFGGCFQRLAALFVFCNRKPLFKQNEEIWSCLCDEILTNFWSHFGSPGQGFLRPPFWTRRRPWGRGCTTNFLLNQILITRKLFVVLIILLGACNKTFNLFSLNLLRFFLINNSTRFILTHSQLICEGGGVHFRLHAEQIKVAVNFFVFTAKEL